MTYYERLNLFYRFIKSNKLQPSSQLLYLHLSQINNELRNVDSFFVSDRALSEMTGLSLSTVSECKAILKNFGLINFKTVNHRTKYFFSENFINRTPDRTLNEQPTEQPPEVRPSVTMPNNNYPIDRGKKNVSVGVKTTSPKRYVPPPQVSEDERQKALAMLNDYMQKGLKSIPQPYEGEEQTDVRKPDFWS